MLNGKYRCRLVCLSNDIILSSSNLEAFIRDTCPYLSSELGSKPAYAPVALSHRWIPDDCQEREIKVTKAWHFQQPAFAT